MPSANVELLQKTNILSYGLEMAVISGFHETGGDGFRSITPSADVPFGDIWLSLTVTSMSKIREHS
jgi:hypothetical protein